MKKRIDVKIRCGCQIGTIYLCLPEGPDSVCGYFKPDPDSPGIQCLYRIAGKCTSDDARKHARKAFATQHS